MLARVVKAADAKNLIPLKVREISGDDHFTPEPSGKFNPPEFVASKLRPIVEPVLSDDDENGTNQTAKPSDDLSAEERAAEIIVKAEADAVVIQEAARERGLSEARAQFETEIAERVSDVRHNLTETIDKLNSLREDVVAEIEPDLVRLALEIAKKVVAREVTIDREIALTLVRISLKRLHSRSDVTVRLHPDDYAYVALHQEKLDFHGAINLVEDRSISLGGCLIQTDTGDIDGRIESQFDEIAEGLLGA